MQVLLTRAQRDCSHWVNVLETSHDDEDVKDLRYIEVCWGSQGSLNSPEQRDGVADRQTEMLPESASVDPILTLHKGNGRCYI